MDRGSETRRSTNSGRVKPAAKPRLLASGVLDTFASKIGEFRSHFCCLYARQVGTIRRPIAGFRIPVADRRLQRSYSGGIRAIAR